MEKKLFYYARWINFTIFPLQNRELDIAASIMFQITIAVLLQKQIDILSNRTASAVISLKPNLKQKRKF